MDEIRNLPNYNTYVIKVMNAVAKQEQNVINQIFNEISEELKKRRKKESVTTERNQKMWNDPESHFRAVQAEEVSDLRMEFDDNLALFELASLIQYKPVMTVEFAKMVQNLNDIRQRTNIRIERNKIVWNDPGTHFRAVQAEEVSDLKNEITDLMSLYNIAQTANYIEGVELITNRLNYIAPNLIDSLIPNNSGTVRK